MGLLVCSQLKLNYGKYSHYLKLEVEKALQTIDIVNHLDLRMEDNFDPSYPNSKNLR